MTWGMAVLRAPIGTSYWKFLGDNLSPGFSRVTSDTSPELTIEPVSGTPATITLTQDATTLGPFPLTFSGGYYVYNFPADISPGPWRISIAGLSGTGSPKTTRSSLLITGGATLLIGDDFDLLAGDDFTLLIAES